MMVSETLTPDHSAERDMILRAAFPWTPSPETIEAMARATVTANGGDPDEILMVSYDRRPGERASARVIRWETYKVTALSNYRAIPIVRELWPDLPCPE